jgi:hypothetical protein
MYATMRSTVFTAVILVVCSLCFIPSIFAHAAYQIEQIPGGDQVFGDFVVGPTKIDLTVEPGQEKLIELMVTNRMGERRLFNLEIEDTKGSDNPGQTVVLLGDDRGPYSLKDYIKIPEMSFELGQGERARIPVTISIPLDAQPGGLYGSVLVTTASLPKEGDETLSPGAKPGSVIVSRIGALFFVTVPGDVEKDGALAGFKTTGDKKYFASGPIDFEILFKNNGSVHLNPFGSITIRNILGEEVGIVPAEPWFAFPASLRLRELSWDRPYLFGKYTAEAKINRGYDGLVDTNTVTFYVIPWTLLGLVFLGFTILFFTLRFIARTFEIKRK